MVSTKEYRGVSGIYKIVCIVTAKVYIGSATDIGQRWAGHISMLNLFMHHSPYLQNSWNKYGPEAFNFTVMEVIEDKDNLITREQYWMDFYRSYKREYGFNVYPKAGSSLGTTQSEETKKKRSELQKGRKRPAFSDVWKNNIATGKSRKWIVIDPDGIQIEVHNLRKFCRENKLHFGAMWKIAQGKQSNHKGWRCNYA